MLYQIEKKISEAVEESIEDAQVHDLADPHAQHVQAVSDPADTTRLHHGYHTPRPSPVLVEDTREYKVQWNNSILDIDEPSNLVFPQ